LKGLRVCDTLSPFKFAAFSTRAEQLPSGNIKISCQVSGIRPQRRGSIVFVLKRIETNQVDPGRICFKIKKQRETNQVSEFTRYAEAGLGKGGYAIGKVQSPSKMNEDETTEKRGESRAGGQIGLVQLHYGRKRENCYCINVLFLGNLWCFLCT